MLHNNKLIKRVAYTGDQRLDYWLITNSYNLWLVMQIEDYIIAYN